MGEPKVGLYLRLSRDDGDREESMSIANQRAFLLRYAQEKGFTVAEAYIDDGFTGTNFDRPGFRRLLSDIASGRIDTVMTKDLSRLGRDQIGTMYYYQIHFPQAGVRYISVTEGMDTATPGGMSLALPFLAAANDFYTADISRKVRAALSTRKQNGLFIGASPPLGYQKDPDAKGRLLPDPRTAPVVRLIFRDYLTHGSVAGTAKRLTEQSIPTPSEWKAVPSAARFPGVWSDTMVRRILTNPTYAGHLTQNRSQKVSYKIRDRRQLKPEDWITVPHTHPPLVDQADFDRAAELLRARSYRNGNRTGGHLLTGLCFCADCGSPMTYVREGGKRTYMVCQGYRRGGRLGLCTAHSIREDTVIEALRTRLRALAGGVDLEALALTLPPDETALRVSRSAELARKQLENCRAAALSLYTDKAVGVLTPQEFEELFAGVRAERARLERYLSECEPEADPEASPPDQLLNLLRFDPLERGTVASLVEKICIHQGKAIEIWFRFTAPQEEGEGAGGGGEAVLS